MAFAIQASLSENPVPSDSNETTESKKADDDEDLALARALAQSEIDERDRLSRMRQVTTLHLWGPLTFFWGPFLPLPFSVDFRENASFSIDSPQNHRLCCLKTLLLKTLKKMR